MFSFNVPESTIMSIVLAHTTIMNNISHTSALCCFTLDLRKAAIMLNKNITPTMLVAQMLKNVMFGSATMNAARTNSAERLMTLNAC